MRALTRPNLPDGDVKKVIIDGRTPEVIIHKLEAMGINVITTYPHPDVYAAVAYHPDIMLHHIGGSTIVYAPETPGALIEKLKESGFRLVMGKTCLSSKYPGTIAYNVARVGNYAFHNTKYTDPVIKDLLLKQGVRLVHVNQGYSKCLTCIVDEKSILTSDTEIYIKACEANIDTLLIEPDTSILLQPFDMGFIGGASGLIGKNRLAFTGNLKFHKNWNEIMEFLSLKAIDVVMLNDDKLLDLGTIIPIMQEK